MNRKEIYKQIADMLGLVPGFFRAIPDSSLEMEWQLFKRVQFEEGPIPNKYRELIGLGVAAATKCRYCALFHTEAAKLNGATDAEIEDAVHFAKSSAGWSTYINGLQIDYDEFKEEIQKIAEYIRVMQEKNKMNEITIAKKALAAVEAGDIDKLATYASDDLTFSGPVPHPLVKEQFLGLMRALVTGIPDWNFNASSYQEHNGKVIIKVQITGTHTHELPPIMPGMSPVPATGIAVALPKEILEVTIKDGKITNMNAIVPPDGGVPGILRQIGVKMPTP